MLVAPDQPCAMAGEVYVVEPMGNETLIDVRIGSERVTVRAGRGFRARIGAPVGVSFDPWRPVSSINQVWQWCIVHRTREVNNDT